VQCNICSVHYVKNPYLTISSL